MKNLKFLGFSRLK